MSNPNTSWFDGLFREFFGRPFGTLRPDGETADADATPVPSEGPPHVPKGPIHVRVQVPGLGPERDEKASASGALGMR